MVSVERVRAYPLDTIIEKYSIPLDMVRHVHLTIGGSEVEALLGAEQLLQQGRLTVFIKSITSYRDSGKRLVSDVIEFLDNRRIPYVVRTQDKDELAKEILIDTRRR